MKGSGPLSGQLTVNFSKIVSGGCLTIVDDSKDSLPVPSPFRREIVENNPPFRTRREERS